MEHNKPIEKTDVIDTEINIDDILTGSIIVPEVKKPTPLTKEEEFDFDDDLGKKIEKEEDVSVDEILDTNVEKTPKPVSSNLIGVVKKLIDKKVILPFEDDKLIEDYEENELEELIEENFNHVKTQSREELELEFFDNLPEEMQYAATYLANGGKDLKSLFKYLSYSEEIKELDPDDENDQEVIVRNYLQATRFGNAEEIQEEIVSWKDRGDLKSKAEKFKPKLDAMQKEVIAQKLKEQELLQKKQQESTRLYMENIHNTVVKSENINGLVIDKKQKDLLFRGLVEPSFTSVTGKQTNLLGHLLEKYQFVEPNHALIAEALWLLVDPTGYKEKLKANVVKDETIKVVKQLKTEEGRRTTTTTEKEENNKSAIARPNKNFLKRNV